MKPAKKRQLVQQLFREGLLLSGDNINGQSPADKKQHGFSKAIGARPRKGKKRGICNTLLVAILTGITVLFLVWYLKLSEPFRGAGSSSSYTSPYPTLGQIFLQYICTDAYDSSPDKETPGYSHKESQCLADYNRTPTQDVQTPKGDNTSDIVGQNSSNPDYTVYNWKPGKPAKIDDPVDDRGFPYNRLKHLRPQSQIIDGLDVVSVELRPKATARRSHVRAYILDDLLSKEECEGLRQVHDQHVRAFSADPIVCFDSVETLRHHLHHIGKRHLRVSAGDFTKGTRCLNNSMSSLLKTWGLQWSTGTGFYLGESSFSSVLDKRIEKVMGLKSANGGAFRIVSYLQNVGYKEHTDCSLSGHKGTEDRFATVLVYLDDVEIGGHTYFPELGISVKPKRGRALVWNSMSKDGKCDPTSLHAAQPVIKGTKYILQRWYYYDNFPGVSARPPIPPIPARMSTQGLVHCDDFRHGSCRLYDVWTYDILTHW